LSQWAWWYLWPETHSIGCPYIDRIPKTERNLSKNFEVTKLLCVNYLWNDVVIPIAVKTYPMKHNYAAQGV